MTYLKTLRTKIFHKINRYILAFLYFSLTLPVYLFGQTYDSLNLLSGHKAQVYYSNEANERAKQIAVRCDKAINYYKEKFDFEPSVKLLILNPEDWTKFTKDAVYGMPHYNDNQTLVIASQDNIFWKSFIPPVDQLSKEMARQITKTYSDKSGNLTMQAFFDLLAIHELGHAFHKQAGLIMQRKWMAELFANLFLHTYIAENEPDLLPTLTVFAQMVISGGTKGLKYTTLAAFENEYDEIAQNHPQNYGWYQCRFDSAAANIYDSGGDEVIKKLWTTLKKQEKNLNDNDLASLLATYVHPSVANVYLKWGN